LYIGHLFGYFIHLLVARSMTFPPFLKPGDTVGVVSPASWFPYDELTEGLRILRDDWQLNVIEGNSVGAPG
jgi:muramoyltetrapeptide carboxypeptidase